MAQAKKGRRSKELKFKAALEAFGGDKTIVQIAEKYGVHPNQVSEWKKQLLEKGADIFAGASEKKEKSSQAKDELLIKTIGKQQVHIDWLKKKLGVSDFELDNL